MGVIALGATGGLVYAAALGTGLDCRPLKKIFPAME